MPELQKLRNAKTYKVLEDLIGLERRWVTPRHNFSEPDGMPLRVDEVQVINTVTTPAAEVDGRLLLVTGCFDYRILAQVIGQLVFLAGQAVANMREPFNLGLTP